MEENVKTKVVRLNIGLSVSQNFNVVKLELIDEPLEISDTEDFDAQVGRTYTRLREQVQKEHYRIASTFPRGAK